MKKVIAFLKSLSPMVIVLIMATLLLFAGFSQYSACRARKGMQVAVDALTGKYASEEKAYQDTIKKLNADKAALVTEGKKMEGRIADMDAERTALIAKASGYEVMAVDASMEKGKIIAEYNKMRGFYIALQEIVAKDTIQIEQLKLLVANKDSIIAKSEEAYASVSKRLADCDFNFNLYKQSYGPKGASLLTKVAVGGAAVAALVLVLKVTKVIK